MSAVKLTQNIFISTLPRERERERETDRQTNRQTDRQDRHHYTGRHTDNTRTQLDCLVFIQDYKGGLLKFLCARKSRLSFRPNFFFVYNTGHLVRREISGIRL